MQKLLIFTCFIALGFFSACKQNNSQPVPSQPQDETVKEDITVKEEPATPKSMDLFADAERHLGGGHRTIAASKIAEGLSALRHEIGAKADVEAKPAISKLQKLQEQLAKNEPVSADILHQAIMGVLVFAPVEMKADVVDKAIEVDKPGGTIPKVYKEEQPAKKQ